MHGVHRGPPWQQEEEEAPEAAPETRQEQEQPRGSMLEQRRGNLSMGPLGTFGSLLNDPFFNSAGSPFARMNRLLGDLEREFNSSFGLTSPRALEMPSLELSPLAGTFSMDVHEDDSGIHFEVDCPGLKREDIKIRVTDGNVLHISAERRHEAEKGDKHFKRVERAHGRQVYYGLDSTVGILLKKHPPLPCRFARSIVLPPHANPDSITAHLESGVLTISVAKEPGRAEKEVPIE